MPVVAIDGRTGNGGKALADAIAASFEGTPVPHGLTALPTATADADMKTADGLSIWAESRADARLDWTAGILRGLDMHAVDHVTLSDRIDRVLLHPVIGVLVFLAVLFVVFQATTTLASPMQDWIDVTFRGWCADGLDLLLGLFGPSVSGGWLRSLLVDGLLDGVVTVLTFIPVMGIMFLLLSILEDSGYMARAAFVMDRAMRALGLDGRAFLPIIVGFGCNLPALAATRTLSDSRQRVLTGMLVPFAACSARLSVFLVLAHAFFPKYAGLVVFLMYVASVMVILLVGVLLRHTMFRGLEPEPLMLALPAYQCPRALQLARSVLLRLWGFIRGASVIIISMITALWLLQGIPVTANAGGFAHVDDVHDSAYGVLADAVAPVFAPAGFDDWHASAALITGFVAKEVVVGSMSQSYHADEPDDAASQQAGEGTLGQKLRASFDQSSHGHGKAAGHRLPAVHARLHAMSCNGRRNATAVWHESRGAIRPAELGRGIRHRHHRLPNIAVDMVSGMERSGASAHGWRRTPRTADTYGDGRNDIVARIAGDIAAGLTVRQIADKRHLPVDFVDMAVERADKRGLLAVMDMRHACGETICQPDPASLVCAGCPFRIFPSSSPYNRQG